MEIERIIESLSKETNDSKKFALLLIIANLIKNKKLDEFEETLSDDECYTFNQRLFKAINPNFLARLLVNTGQPENCPKNTYKSVAMSILVQFLNFPDLLTDPVLLTKIKVLFDYVESFNYEILISQNDEKELEENLIENCFKYFYALCGHCYNHMCKNGLLKSLSAIIINNAEISLSKYSEISVELFLNVLKNDMENKFECVKEVEEFLNNIYDQLKSTPNVKIEKKIVLFKLITKFYKSSFYFGYLENNRKLNEALQKEIIREIDGFLRMQRMDKSFIYEFLNDFLTHFDCKLIFDYDKKLFYLIIHLVSIDIRISLESPQINLLESNAQMTNLVTNLSVFEKLLVYVENIPEDDIKEDKTLLDDTIKIFVEVINSTLIYLKDMLDETKYVNKAQQLFFIALIRLAACWFSFEELSEEDYFKMLPKILEFFKYYYEKNKTREINVYLFILPCLHRFLENNKSTYEIVKKKTSNFNEEDLDLIEMYDNLIDIEIQCQNSIKSYLN